MNDHQRSIRAQESSAQSSFSSTQTGRKLVICLLAMTIAAAMIAWFGILGWGFVTLLQWIFDGLKSWMAYLKL